MIRFHPLFAVLVASASLAGTSAMAQEPPRATGKPDRETQRRAVFDRTDANKDGFIDRSESRTVREALFDRLDINRDGRLTVEELSGNHRSRSQASRSRDGGVNAQTETAPGGTAGRRPTRAERELQRLDTNRDGAISRVEWLAADDTRFERCDRNKDGKLAYGECSSTRRGQQRAAIR